MSMALAAGVLRPSKLAPGIYDCFRDVISHEAGDAASLSPDSPARSIAWAARLGAAEVARPITQSRMCHAWPSQRAPSVRASMSGAAKSS